MEEELTPIQFIEFLMDKDTPKGVYNNKFNNKFLVEYKLDSKFISKHMRYQHTNLTKWFCTKHEVIQDINISLRKDKILKLKSKWQKN